MATIELGEISASPPVEPERHAPRQRPPSRGLRVGVLLLLSLLTMAGAAVAPGPLPEAGVPARLGAGVFTGGDRLIVADPVNIRENQQWLTAYRLSDGTRLWRVPMPLRGNAGPWTVVDGTLLMGAEWGAVIPSETVALDLATGAERWRRLAWLDGVTPAGEALLWTRRLGDWTQGEERPGTLRAVSLATGSERWSVPLPAGTVRAYEHDTGWSARRGDGRLRQLVTALPSGEVQVRDLDSGRVVRAARIPGPETGRRNIEVAAGLVLNHAGRDGVTAYALESLTPLWTLTRATNPREYGPLPCANLLCIYGETGGVRALDPRTGRVLWTEQRRWGTLLAADDRLIAVDGQASRAHPRSLMVVDPATGAVLRDLGVWNVLGPAPGGGLLAVRPGPQERTWVARLDPETGTYRLLDRLRDVSGDCQTGSGVLHCRRMNGSIGIWRLPG